MKKEIPSFYDRYKGKFSTIIEPLTIINNISVESGLNELFLNGNKEANYFGGCDECRSILTYQVQATSSSLKINNKPPIIIEIEKGYNYQPGGNPDYFINFRIQEELLEKKYDELTNFSDKCFLELTGNKYNLVLTQNFDGYINLIYVPIKRQEFVSNTNGSISNNPIVWLISSIVNNNSNHKYYADSIPSDIYDELTLTEKALIEQYTESNTTSTSELSKRLIKRLENNYQK